MFRASLCPSSGEQDRVLLHVVFCTGCAGCGCVELGRKLCAVCEGYCSNSELHTAYDSAPHNQCRTPYAVIHGLVLLMIGIMMPETCWDRSLIINIGLVASCRFISLHPMFHDARSQEPKTYPWHIQAFRRRPCPTVIILGLCSSTARQTISCFLMTGFWVQFLDSRMHRLWNPYWC